MEPTSQGTSPEAVAPSAQGGNTPGSNTPTPESTRTIMAILAYLGILIIIPFLMSKHEPFVKFHLKQGAVLFIIEVILWSLSMTMMWMFIPIIGILNLGVLVLAVIGIVNAFQGKEKEVPLVGQFAKHLNF